MAASGKIIVITDDHPLFRLAIRHTVQALVPQATILEADSLHSLQQITAKTPQIDFAFLDLEIPGASGFSSLLHLQSAVPQARVTIVSGVENPLCLQSAKVLGAAGFVPKSTSPPDMSKALRLILDGGSWFPGEPSAAAANDAEDAVKLESLTRQELRILLGVGAGLMNKQIAYDLGISEGTVKVHMKSVLRKLDATTRTQAALMAQKVLNTLPTDRASLLQSVHASTAP